MPVTMSESPQSAESLAKAVAAVEGAFQHTPYPQGCLFQEGFFCETEWQEVCRQYEGKLWYDLELPFLLSNYDALYVFSASAYRYYLPAFLLAILREHDESDHLVGEVISTLLPPDQLTLGTIVNPLAFVAYRSNQKSFRERLKLLSHQQRDAIVMCLHHIVAFEDEDDYSIKALEYWRMISEH
jgi:hypothetical protein